MLKRGLMKLVALVVGVFVATVAATPVFAAPNCTGEFIETNILGQDWAQGHGICDDGKGGGIFDIMNVILTVLTFGVGTGATVGFVISGYQYLTAQDNQGQVAKAKSRMFNIVLGLIAYAVMWTFLQWILPGGIFGTGA